MANIKSAKKRVLVSQAKADRNKSARSKVKTYIIMEDIMPWQENLHKYPDS